jgi:carbon monoxide dehydrogenase subunit G
VGSPFRYDETFDFGVPRDVLWDALNDVEQFPRWWPWLRSFDAGAEKLLPGTVANCAVRGPLPYTLEFQVHVEQVEPGLSIDTRVSGDLEGRARLEIGRLEGAGDDASTARLSWSVDLHLPLLSVASRFARPMLVWAHDRVVTTGVAQFREHALSNP